MRQDVIIILLTIVLTHIVGGMRTEVILGGGGDDGKKFFNAKGHPCAFYLKALSKLFTTQLEFLKSDINCCHSVSLHFQPF